jgi:hypothetical protein
MARSLAISIVLVVSLPALLLHDGSRPAAAWDGCTLDGDLRGTTCALRDGDAVSGALDGGSATYRVDSFAADATLDLELVGTGGMRVDVLDWRGDAFMGAGLANGLPSVRLSTKLTQPGTYGVRVSGDPSLGSSKYSVTSRLISPGVAAQPVWPSALRSGDGPIGNERQIISVPRGGTPSAGVAASRILTAPPVGIFGDFTLVSDVQFGQIAGPAALTVRFRYEPEAGGGTGYLLSIDPFGGTVSLDYFDEGQRRAIVEHTPLPLTLMSDQVHRLVLSAHGENLQARLDGLSLFETTDTRFVRGLVAVGAVTWSDPVVVTFDHLQVSVPPR